MTDLRAWKERHWKIDPRCAYCGVVTVLDWSPIQNNRRVQPPLNLATVDHLRDRFDPTRQIPSNGTEIRRVLACWECNWTRGVIREKEQSIEELRRRASH